MRLVCSTLVALAMLAAVQSAEAKSRFTAPSKGGRADHSARTASYSSPAPIRSASHSATGCACNACSGGIASEISLTAALDDITDTLDAAIGGVGMALNRRRGCGCSTSGCDDRSTCGGGCGGCRMRGCRPRFDRCFGGCRGETLWAGYCGSKPCGCGGVYSTHGSEVHELQPVTPPGTRGYDGDMQSPPRPPADARFRPLFRPPLSRGATPHGAHNGNSVLRSVHTPTAAQPRPASPAQRNTQGPSQRENTSQTQRKVRTASHEVGVVEANGTTTTSKFNPRQYFRIPANKVR